MKFSVADYGNLKLNSGFGLFWIVYVIENIKIEVGFDGVR